MRTPKQIIEDLRDWSHFDHSGQDAIEEGICSYADELEWGVDDLEARANKLYNALRKVQSCLATTRRGRNKGLAALADFVDFTLDDVADIDAGEDCNE